MHHNLSSASDSIDNMRGYYSSPSTRCTKFSDSKDDFISCEREFRDCLMIKRIDQKTADVEIYSTQANQHVCAVNGTAKIINGKLILYLGVDGKEQHLSFISKNNRVLIKQHAPIGQQVENCGVHANFDGLSFKMVDREINKHRCFND